LKKEHAVHKAIRFIQTYLVVSIPFVAAAMIWGTFQTQEQALASGALLNKVLWEVLSWNLMIWFAVLVLFLVVLVVQPSARENTLKRLANLKERDEREEWITGRASRAAYLASLSLLILALFFSVFSFDISRSAVSIGLHFSFFEATGIALSKAGLVLVLLVWQLLTFNLAARREHLVG
jgi:hypothetical protein